MADETPAKPAPAPKAAPAAPPAPSAPPVAAEPPTPAPPPPAPPRKVRLVRPCGFIDDFKAERFWKSGAVVGDPAEVALLVEHGAPIEDVP